MDELGAFINSGHSSGESQDGTASVKLDLLVFEFQGNSYGALAERVESVVPWRQPTPIPSAGRSLAGVFQDRGRIVALLNHPAGRGDLEERVRVQRVIICSTPRGYLGLPADSTLTIGPVQLPEQPRSGDLTDSKLGPFTYINPEELLRDLQ